MFNCPSNYAKNYGLTLKNDELIIRHVNYYNVGLGPTSIVIIIVVMFAELTDVQWRLKRVIFPAKNVDLISINFPKVFLVYPTGPPKNFRKF